MTLALARPEKRLFVSLITRDITLADAILDLIDNSINAAMHNVSNPLNSAKAFYSFLTNASTQVRADIHVEVNERSISVTDDAGGIPFRTAQNGIFHFGATAATQTSRDRLSVFGIGLKRAMFKIGNDIHMISNHPQGGFALTLDAKKWEQTPQKVWGFEISALPRNREANAGTVVKIMDLHEDVRRRVADKTFVATLREKIAKTYSYFLGSCPVAWCKSGVALVLSGRDWPDIKWPLRAA